MKSYLEDLNIHPEVLNLKKELIFLRREIHKYPELLYDLPKTSQLVKTYLRTLGLEVHSKVGVSGVVGVLRGEGPCVLLRADMDALPIEETANLEYKSAYPGKMHACGHDAHVAMLLVAAKVLVGLKDRIKGSVKFLFQPAEEGGHGANAMIQDKTYPVLSASPIVEEVYAVHVTNSIPIGDFLAAEEFASANSAYFHIDLKQKLEEANCVYVGAQVISSIQNISSLVPPEYTMVLSTTVFQGNPEFCKVGGTIRNYEEQVKETLYKNLKNICKGVEATFGVQANVWFEEFYSPTVNDPVCTAKASNAFTKVVSKAKRHTDSPLIGEDFCYFTKEKPGCFLMLGCATEEKNHPIHSKKFELEEEALLIGCSYWVQLVEDLLIR
mgnify:FL=1